LSNHTINEAKKMLKLLELEHNKISASQLTFSTNPIIEYVKKDSDIEKELSNLDLNNLTPIDALNILSNMKKKI